MKRRILQYLITLAITIGVGGAVMSLATPGTALAAKQKTDKCSEKLLTFPTWFRGLTDSNCNIKSPSSYDTVTKGVNNGDGLSVFIWKIVLNIVEIILQLVGYLSVAFIIAGGYRYMTSAGSAEGMVKARKTITNAVVGLILSILSVTIVNVIAGAII